MKRSTLLTGATALVATAIAIAGDGGAAPGLWGGVSYLGPEELSAEIARRDEDLARAQTRIVELEDRISTLEPEIEKLSEERQQQALQARKTIILHDRMSRGGMLRIVLGAQNLTDAAVFTQMYSKMLDRESVAFAELSEKEKDLEDKKALLQKDREMLEQLTADLEAHKENLEARRKTLLNVQ